MYGGDDAWIASQKAHTGKVEQPIIVVHDGKAPREAAKNLWHYLGSLGYETKLVDADDYKKGHLGSVIVVGHHDLSKELVKYLGIRYNDYGMACGFCGNLCVLRASRSAIESKKQFAVYYNNEMSSHRALASRYAIPLLFGHRDETRESQYDLLLIQFIQNGLGDFLGAEDEPTEPQAVIHPAPHQLHGVDKKDAPIGPLEVSAEIELNKSWLKCAVSFEKLLKCATNTFLSKQRIPANLGSLKVQKVNGNIFCVDTICTISNCTAFFQFIPPKMKRAGALAVEGLNIFGEDISDDQKVQFVIKAVKICEDKICKKLTEKISKKIKGIVVHSLDIKKAS